MLVDLHAHTYPRSLDSSLSPQEAVALARACGLEGVCFTEHDTFWSRREIEALQRQIQFPVFAGCEVTTEEGHLLVFGLEEYVFGMHRALFLWEHAQSAGGALLAAHPYRRRLLPGTAPGTDHPQQALERALQDPLFRLVQGLEVYNGRARPEETAFSTELAHRLRLPGTGGSDAHTAQEAGRCATQFAGEVRTLDDLVAHLRAGRFSPVSLSAPQVEHGHVERPAG